MGPHWDDSPIGAGIQYQTPPPDYYSPHSCGNCHTATSENPLEVYRTPPSFLKPESLLQDQFLPSPSDCSAETFWAESLKSFQGPLQTNPSLRSQAYLQTLLDSRKGQFPAQIQEPSLQVYLGLNGGVSFPLKTGAGGVNLARDAMLCAGAPKVSPNGDFTCKGLEWDLREEDIGIVLGNQELMSASHLEAELTGWWGKVRGHPIIPGAMLPGAEIHGVSVREGRLILTLKLSDPFFNAMIPLLPAPLKPNPFSPELYDLDLTEAILKKLPVAFDPSTGERHNLESYNQASDKARLKLLPYFFQLAREGGFPDRLSLSRLYESIVELGKAPPPKIKTDFELDKWLPLLQSLQVQGNFRPDTFSGFGAFVEFAPETDKNSVTASLKTDDFKNFFVNFLAPLHLTRLFLPGRLDVTDLKGTLEVHSPEANQFVIQLHDLDLELGPVEWGAPDPASQGLMAIRGGRIASTHPARVWTEDLIPALKITGNPGAGWEVTLHLDLDKVKLRLPGLGEISLSGEVEVNFQLVPEYVDEFDAEGNPKTRLALRMKPEGLKFQIKNGLVENADGVWLQDLALTLNTPEVLIAGDRIQNPFLDIGLTAKQFKDGTLLPVEFYASVPVPKTAGGNLDFGEMLRNLDLQASGILQRGQGMHQEWGLSVKGGVEGGFADYRLNLQGSEIVASTGKRRDIIRDFEAHWVRESEGKGSRIQLDLQAPRLDLGEIQLNHLKGGLELLISETPEGKTIWKVPRLRVSANNVSGDPLTGILRGPLWMKSLASAGRPLTLQWDPDLSTLEIKNGNIQIGVERITPPNLLKATRGKIGSFDIDGRLLADWKMNVNKKEGRGKIVLRGDNEGDIHLRNAKGMRLEKPDPRDETYLVETPMFANTVWELTRITGIDSELSRIRGRFHLQTDIDPAVARVFGIIIDAGKVLSSKLSHDHLPYTWAGFLKKGEEYLRTKFSQESREEDTP